MILGRSAQFPTSVFGLRTSIASFADAEPLRVPFVDPMVSVYCVVTGQECRRHHVDAREMVAGGHYTYTVPALGAD